MSHTKDSVSRYAVLLVNSSSRRPIGLLVESVSLNHAKAFIRHFNRRIKSTWPDRKAIMVPII